MELVYFTLFVCSALFCNVAADIRDFIIESESDLAGSKPTSAFSDEDDCYSDNEQMEDIAAYGNEQYSTDDIEWMFRFASEEMQNQILNGDQMREAMRNIMSDPRFQQQYLTWKSVAQSVTGKDDMAEDSSCQTVDAHSNMDLYSDIDGNILYDNC